MKILQKHQEDHVQQKKNQLVVCVASPVSSHCGNSNLRQKLASASWFSKGIILILIWNLAVAIIHGIVKFAMLEVAIRQPQLSFSSAVYLCCGMLGTIAFGHMVVYPFSGILADVRCGRYKVIFLSLSFVTLSFLLQCIAGILFFMNKLDILTAFASGTGVIIVLLGSSGFRANALQFGLDQLLDSPSKTLSYFIWVYVWTANFGEMLVVILGSQIMCYESLQYYLAVTLPAAIFVFTVFLLFLTCCKSRWFYCERKTHNPYKMIYRVLNFVAKNKHPLKRSSLTFCGDEIPSRIDFAKKKYGGPFTTEEVENIKTFLKILLALFTVSCIYYYTIPGNIMFIIYSVHLGINKPAYLNPHCYSEWVFIQSGNLRYLVTLVAIPLYLLVFKSCVEKWLSLILQRLVAGIIVLVLFMWTVSILYGVALASAQHASCLFTSEYRNTKNFTQTLQFPIEYLIVPETIAGVGWPIVNAAIFEFISAQSPHTMKGVLFGVFYFFCGFYNLLSILTVFPFTSHLVDTWTKHSRYLECGFLYYIFNSLVGVAFIVASMVTYKYYKYRQREDKPYDQRYVVDYYSKYISRRNVVNAVNVSVASRVSCSSFDYGTFRS